MGCTSSSNNGKERATGGIMSHMVRERKKGQRVEDLFETISMIGKGSVGMISKVKNRRTGLEYALKTIQLEKISSKLAKEMRNEIEILKRLDHPNIIRAIETFETDRRVYLVMKLCTGGDLHSRAPYSERQVGSIITKLLSATWYMHQHGVVHRDLKLENVVYESTAPDADIFIIDYGLSKIIDTNGARMKEMVGTLYTMAPEVLLGTAYDSSCDMWSIGVMTFLLLSGDMPFDFTTKQRLVKSVEDGRYEFSGRRWDRITSDARSFVRHMMVKQPSKRYTAGQALQHRWIRNSKAACSRNTWNENRRLGRKDHDRIIASMKNYACYSKVKRTALMLVAYRSRPEDTKAMREAFKTYDIDQNGSVSRSEFEDVLRNEGYTDEELVGLFDEVDEDHDGQLHYTEFLAATLETCGAKVAEERLTEAFDQMDLDESGSISRDNLMEFLGRDSKGYDVEELIAEADGDGTGGINLEDFSKHMRKSGRFSIPIVSRQDAGETTVDGGGGMNARMDAIGESEEQKLSGTSSLYTVGDSITASQSETTVSKDSRALSGNPTGDLPPPPHGGGKDRVVLHDGKAMVAPT